MFQVAPSSNRTLCLPRVIWVFIISFIGHTKLSCYIHLLKFESCLQLPWKRHTKLFHRTRLSHPCYGNLTTKNNLTKTSLGRSDNMSLPCSITLLDGGIFQQPQAKALSNLLSKFWLSLAEKKVNFQGRVITFHDHWGHLRPSLLSLPSVDCGNTLLVIDHAKCFVLFFDWSSGWVCVLPSFTTPPDVWHPLPAPPGQFPEQRWTQGRQKSTELSPRKGNVEPRLLRDFFLVKETNTKCLRVPRMLDSPVPLHS